MQLLLKSCDDNLVFLEMEASSLTEVLGQIVDRLVERGTVDPGSKQEIIDALVARERQGSSAIGHAVAVPHAYLDALKEPAIVIARLADDLNLGAPDGIPTRFVFALLGPQEATAGHLDSLATIARVMSDDEFRYEAGSAHSVDEFRAALQHFIDRVREPRPKPHAEELHYSGRFGGGLMRDIRARLPHYASDWLDGLHPKCVSAIVFLFFACLAPAITFGGVMSVETEGNIGVVEMIVASAVCGVIYALVSGQPLIILGGTGPMLVFTAILFQLCQDLEIAFLPTYAWVGIWTAVILLVLALTDASCLMRYFTRFTDEIFAALISIIFIYEAIHRLVDVFAEAGEQQNHDKPLLSLLLAIGTFYIAMRLSAFRRSRYLLSSMREFLADFGPAIAILAMTLVASWQGQVELDALAAPDHIGTTTGRAWLSSPFSVPVWIWFAAIGPAILASVLVFLDQNITARLVNSPDHNLQKGGGYHVDLAVVAGLTGFCSLFGLPWLVAATVRSLNHVRGLATIEERVSRDGQAHQHVLHVRENRLTGLAIHALLACSLFLLPLIKLVPMAVLYGLFLYMGVVSMKGNQFFERLSLVFTDPSLYPATHYVRRVPFWTMHAMTAIQAGCLAVLWFVKTSALGILFPLFIALLVPVRGALRYLFQSDHLLALDAEEEPEEEDTHWS